jgi:hydroxymethylpyrimidine/phosphomethylpyrimidine kinase
MPISAVQPPPAVLAIAASDPSGGAGIQADILTLASMGCHPLTVITAITVQNTSGVEDLQAIDADWVADQARCILEDVPVTAFKLGVLGSLEIVTAIAEVIADYPDVPLIFDPVLASGRGDELAADEMLEAMKELLIPQTTIITPNVPELRRLAHDDDSDDDTYDNAILARRLIDSGCEYVLVTGTHDSTPEVINTLYQGEGIVRADTWQHAGFRDCRYAGTRPRRRGCRARSAGIHMADAKGRLPTRHGSVHPRPSVLGARGSGRGPVQRKLTR